MTQLSLPKLEYLIGKTIKKIVFEIHKIEQYSSLSSLLIEFGEIGILNFRCDTIGQSILIIPIEKYDNYPIDLEECGSVILESVWNKLSIDEKDNLKIYNISLLKDDLYIINGIQLMLSNNSNIKIFNLGDELYCEQVFL